MGIIDFTCLQLADGDEVQIGGDFEFVFLERRRHGLPLGGGLEDLPVVLGSGADGHPEAGLIGLPAVGDRARGLVELELQSGERAVAQVLVEDRRQVHAGLLVEIAHHVFGHDVLIFEVLVEIVEQGPPAGIVIHHAAQGIEEERSLEVLVLGRFLIDAARGDDGLQVADPRLVPSV